MRPLEALLLLANLLAFSALVLRRPRSLAWRRHSALGALLAAAAQAFAEGPRWQLLPAYTLSALLGLVWLGLAVAAGPAVQRRSRGLAARAALGLGALVMAVAVALPNVFPVFHFPRPTGPYPIGTLTYHWIDPGRLEVFGDAPQAARELMVQVWYPAAAHAASARAPYMQDAEAVTSALARIHGKPAFAFGHFKYAITHALVSAPVAGAHATYPVLLFLEGVTGFRQMNTYQVEALVSHGYIVVAIDQPGVAAAVVFPDRRQVTGMTLAQVHASIDASYMARPDAPRRIGRVPTGVELIRYLAQDAVTVLDRLAALNRADPNGILTGKLNLQQAGAFGVSLGGIVVAEACRQEPRLKACLMLDAPMPADVVSSGLQQPSMWITRDADGMRLERQRAGGWSEEEVLAHQSTMRAVYQSLPGAGYFVQVRGTFHSNFTDLPNWSPWTPQMRLSGPIDGQRAHDIVNACSLAFFDRHVAEAATGRPDLTAMRYPEARIESRRP